MGDAIFRSRVMAVCTVIYQCVRYAHCTTSIERVYSSLPRRDGVCITRILVINPKALRRKARSCLNRIIIVVKWAFSPMIEEVHFEAETLLKDLFVFNLENPVWCE